MLEMFGKLFRYVASLFLALLNIGQQDKVSPKPVCTITLKLEGLDEVSKGWAARRWTSTNGATFVRACYVQGELPN